jgi:hypothetical protein
MANEYWVKAYDSGELAASATSVTISSLNGDTDEEYELIVRLTNDEADACYPTWRINGDTGNNYGFQVLDGYNATASAARNVNAYGYLYYQEGMEQNGITFAHAKIYAKSGKVRTFISKVVENIKTTTVTDLTLWGGSWNNTADNITSISINASADDTLGIGSRIILLKKASTGTPAWQKVADTTLGSAATSYTFSSLNGNTDVIYRLTVRAIGGVNGANYNIRLNNDSGNNYGYQMLEGWNTTVTAVRNVYSSIQSYYDVDGTANDIQGGEFLIYAKSGYVRTVLGSLFESITSTTVNANLLQGNSWNNTADNLTSIVVGNEETNGLGIGTYLCLEKLAL